MMNKKEILKKVGDIISELSDQYEYLSENPENLNDLELELFAANSEFLSNHISILIKLNGNLVGHKTANPVAVPLSEPSASISLDPLPVEAVKPPQEAVVLPDWKSQFTEEDKKSFDYEEKNTSELFDRPLTEDEIRVIDEKTRLKSTTEPVEKIEESIQPPISVEPVNTEIAETLSESVTAHEEISLSLTEEKESAPVSKEPVRSEETVPLSLNEILSAQTLRTTVSSQFTQRQPKDLKSMISLNDKLLFVRDLFNGYSLAYSEAIELLNRFDNFESADNFLKQNYASKNSWSDKQDAADKFYELLNKRFSN